MKHVLIAWPCGASLFLLVSLGSAEVAPTPSSPPPRPPHAEPSPSSAEPSPSSTEPSSATQTPDQPQGDEAASGTDQKDAPPEATAPASTVPLDDSAPPAVEVAPDPTPPPPSKPALKDDYENASSVPLDDSRLKAEGHAPHVRFLLGILYNTALPLGETADFNHRFSGRGFTVEGTFRGEYGLRGGVSFGFQVFQEKADRTVTYGDATVGGVQVRETSLSPMTAHLGYALEQLEKVVPYVRLGVGGGRAWRRLDIGIRRFVDESWHFVLVPELGVEIPAGRIVVLGSVRYNYFFKGDDAPAQSYMNFSVGLGFD